MRIVSFLVVNKYKQLYIYNLVEIGQVYFRFKGKTYYGTVKVVNSSPAFFHENLQSSDPEDFIKQVTLNNNVSSADLYYLLPGY